MSWQDLLLIFTAGINFGVGVFILFKNFRQKLNISYFFMALGMSLWAIFLVAFRIQTRLELVDFWGRASFDIGLFMCISFYYFTVYFPYEDHKLKRVFHYIFADTLLIFIFLIHATRLFILRPEIVDGAVSMRADIYIHITYGAILVLIISCGLARLYKKMTVGGSIFRRQASIIFFVSVIAAIVGTICNIILPILSDYSLNWLGPQLLVLFSIAVGFISFAPKITING